MKKKIINGYILNISKYKGLDIREVVKKDINFVIWFIRKFSYKYEVYKISKELEKIIGWI